MILRNFVAAPLYEASGEGNEGGEGGESGESGDSGNEAAKLEAEAAEAKLAAEAKGKSEGKSSSSWRDSFTDDKLKTQSERYDSPQGMLENINKLNGEISQRIRVPGEDASDEDLSKYRKALGVPDKASDYAFTTGTEADWTDADKEVLGSIGEIFHKHNVPAEGARGVVEAYNALAAQSVAEQEKATVDAHNEAVAELKQEWGHDYDANINLVAQFRERVTDDNFKAFLEEAKLGSGALVADDPAMVRFLARMARATEETQLMLGVGDSEGRSLQEQIDSMEAEHPPGTEGYKDRGFQRKLTELYDRRYGKEGVVGEDQRLT